MKVLLSINFADDKKSKELVNNLSNINERVDVIGKERPKISENIGNQKLYGSNDDINKNKTDIDGTEINRAKQSEIDIDKRKQKISGIEIDINKKKLLKVMMRKEDKKYMKLV